LVIIVGLIGFAGWSLLKNSPAVETTTGEPAADTIIITPARTQPTATVATPPVTVTTAMVIAASHTTQATAAIPPTPRPTLLAASYSQYVELPEIICLDMDLSPDGRTLAVAGYGGTWLYSMDTLEGTLFLDNSEGYVTHSPLSWAPDSRMLAVSWGREIRIMDTLNQEIVQGLAQGDRSVIFDLNWSPAGHWLFARATYDTFWDLTQERPTHFAGPEHISSGSWSPDGNRIALGTDNGLIINMNILENRPLRSLVGHTGRITDLAWSPDGQWLASAEASRSIRIWDVEGSTTLHTIEGVWGDIEMLAWSDDSQYLASAHNNGIIYIWDGNRGQAIYKLWGHQGRVIDIAWLPDGRLLSLGYEDGALRIWSIPASP
jgi:WD40 repeat protein